MSDNETFHSLQKYVSVDTAAAVIQHGRSFVYDLLGTGDLTAVKDGKRTYVLIESIRAYQARVMAQPPAKFAASPRKIAADQPRRRRRRSSKAVIG
jgi:hypothetical protein